MKLGPVYTKRQRQRRVNPAMTLATQLLLATMESLQNGLQPHSQATSLWPMRTVLQASSQHWRQIDFDAWCKRALAHFFVHKCITLEVNCHNQEVYSSDFTDTKIEFNEPLGGRNSGQFRYQFRFWFCVLDLWDQFVITFCDLIPCGVFCGIVLKADPVKSWEMIRVQTVESTCEINYVEIILWDFCETVLWDHPTRLICKILPWNHFMRSTCEIWDYCVSSFSEINQWNLRSFCWSFQKISLWDLRLFCLITQWDQPVNSVNHSMRSTCEIWDHSVDYSMRSTCEIWDHSVDHSIKSTCEIWDHSVDYSMRSISEIWYHSVWLFHEINLWDLRSSCLIIPWDQPLRSEIILFDYFVWSFFEINL